jgi:hypothetical protein
MKIITTQLSNRSSYFTSAQPSRLLSMRDRLEWLLNWLGGVDHHTFSIAEKLISRNLPQGIKVPQASAVQLGQATKAALEGHNDRAEEIVRFVFASLKSHDGEKGEAVVGYIVSALGAQSVAKIVRIAVRARPSLASTIARTAATLVPEKAAEITSAIESVVITVPL